MNAPVHRSAVAPKAWPGLTPRLLSTSDGIETVSAYQQDGGYQALDDVAALIDQVDQAGLLGRGGAAFPMSVKLRTVRDAHLGGVDTVVVANGEEGEPASIKDRWLLRNRPHLVLDGLRLAAHIVGARHAHVYVSDFAAAEAVRAAVAELTEVPSLAAAFGVSVSVRTVEPGYVAGEESAAVQAINGGPAKPTDKPPRPYQVGVGGLPTLVSNVETLANLPYIHTHGAQKYRDAGTPDSPGTFLATITGGGLPAGLYELPFGVPAADVVAWHGISPSIVRGALIGGYFAGLLGPEVLGLRLDHGATRSAGAGLGCGALALLTDECPVAVAASVLAYFDRENAGQCGSCFNGTAAMAAVAAALRDGVASADDLARLRRWSVQLRGRGACATLDAATNIAASLLAKFGDQVARHLDCTCDTCAAGVFLADRPYEVEAV